MKMERKGRAASVLKGFVEAAKVVDQRRSDIVSVVRFNREWERPGSFGGTFANAWYGPKSVKRSGICVWKTREEAIWYRFCEQRDCGKRTQASERPETATATGIRSPSK